MDETIFELIAELEGKLAELKRAVLRDDAWTTALVDELGRRAGLVEGDREWDAIYDSALKEAESMAGAQ